MDEPEGRYWFPAKRRGLGWGLPVRWQGWVVLAAFVVLAGGGVLLGPWGSVLATLVAICLLGGAAYVKGDPDGRHWR